MKRCWGFTRNLSRCQRTGDWYLYCHDHKRQWLLIIFTLIFTVGGGAASLLSFLSLADDKYIYGNEQDKENKAWQLLITHAPGNSGKKWALEYLNNIAKKPLGGVNLSSSLNGGSVIINELQLIHADLEGSNFEKAISNKSDFSFSNMNSVNFRGAELNGCKFINANLAYSDFSDANMSSSNLSKANLKGADFSAANLTDAKLEGADLSHAKFEATDLSNVDFSNSTVWEIVVTRDTNIRNTDLSTITFPAYVYNSYGTGSDPTEPTPLQCAMSLCSKLRTLEGAATAKLPKKLTPEFECTY